jgi:3,4-dihydroxy 2-butanone 4-phosphate synthase/GTP cyclohydrolase II
VDESSYLALVKGDIATGEPVLVRVDSGCLTGHVFGSVKCDCRWQLEQAMARVEAEGRGVILYIAGQEGRGIGICNKIRAYALQENGYDTVEANEMLGFKPDERDYGIGAQVLWDLGVRRMRLLSNNPAKYTALTGYGLEVVERVPLVAEPSEMNRTYLETKARKMGHLLDWAEQGSDDR